MKGLHAIRTCAALGMTVNSIASRVRGTHSTARGLVTQFTLLTRTPVLRLTRGSTTGVWGNLYLTLHLAQFHAEKVAHACCAWCLWKEWWKTAVKYLWCDNRTAHSCNESYEFSLSEQLLHCWTICWIVAIYSIPAHILIAFYFSLVFKLEQYCLSWGIRVESFAGRCWGQALLEAKRGRCWFWMIWLTELIYTRRTFQFKWKLIYESSRNRAADEHLLKVFDDFERPVKLWTNHEK